jgi:hypothetical protein
MPVFRQATTLCAVDADTGPRARPAAIALVWDRRDSAGEPVPRGSYRIVVDMNRERGEYSKGAATLVCAQNEITERIASAANWDDLSIQYGPTPA